MTPKNHELPEILVLSISSLQVSPEIYQFAQISLLLEAKFRDDP